MISTLLPKKTPILRSQEPRSVYRHLSSFDGQCANMSAKQPSKKQHLSGDGANEEDVKYSRNTHAFEEEDAKDIEDDEEENELDDDDEEEEEEDEEEDVVCSLWRPW